MTGLTYDTGALVAAERSDRLLWSLHRAAVRRGVTCIVPAPVLAQAWRGGPQARLSQLLRGCDIETLDEDQARSAGALCATSGTSDIVDATVVVGAIARNDAVVTSDRGDIAVLANAAGRKIVIHSV